MVENHANRKAIYKNPYKFLTTQESLTATARTSTSKIGKAITREGTMHVGEICGAVGGFMVTRCSNNQIRNAR
jgi:hypothetical protein